jgi:magnesium-transporting ATPase (P-type)
LATGEDGLDAAEAAARQGVVGPNLLPSRSAAGVAAFLGHFNDTLIFILLGAAAIKAVMGDWLDFWVIMTVAVINAVIGYVQEGGRRRRSRASAACSPRMRRCGAQARGRRSPPKTSCPATSSD